MREPIELHELEILQVIEQFADDAFESTMNTANALPSRNYKSQTAREIIAAIAQRKLEKFEALLTDVLDRQRAVCDELGKAYEPPFATDSPVILKRKIQDLDMEFAAIAEQAYLHAMQYGWTLTGAVDNQTGEYKFTVSPLRNVFQRRVA